MNPLLSPKKISLISLLSAISVSANSFEEYSIGNAKFIESFSSRAYWKEITLDERSYCDSSFLENLTNQNLYLNSKKNQYVLDWFSSSPLGSSYALVYSYRYYSPTSLDNSYTYTNDFEPAAIFNARLTCDVMNHDLFYSSEIANVNTFSINFLYDEVDPDDVSDTNREELGIFSIESDATYFNSSRGPRIQAEIDFNTIKVDSTRNIEPDEVVFSIEYYDFSDLADPWKSVNVSTHVTEFTEALTALVSNADENNYMLQNKATIEAILPYPTIARLKIDFPDGVPISNNEQIEIYDVKFLTEECIFDQSFSDLENPCLTP